VRVVFELYCPVFCSEDVHVVGSLPELGAWDTAKAVPLKPCAQQYPLWRSAELLLPSKTLEEAFYKYVKIFGGSVVQWESGPNRILELDDLSQYQLNCIEDVPFDIDDSILRRNGKCARSVEAPLRFPVRFTCLKSQATSLETSRFASRNLSPLRTSVPQTPVEQNASCILELQKILMELMGLEQMDLAGRQEIRRAQVAVRSAIEAERKSGGRYGGRYELQRNYRSCSGVGLSLLLVPLLPVVVATAIMWRFPSARVRKSEIFREARAAIREASRSACSWSQGLGQARLLRPIASRRRVLSHPSAQGPASGSD